MWNDDMPIIKRDDHFVITSGKEMCNIVVFKVKWNFRVLVKE